MNVIFEYAVAFAQMCFVLAMVCAMVRLLRGPAAQDRVLAIGKHVPVRSAMGESVGIELFSAASSRKLFGALDARVNGATLVYEYYEAWFQPLGDEGGTRYGVDSGSM